MKIFVWLVVLFAVAGCDPQEGEGYKNAGDPCWLSGSTAVDEDTGHALVCKRDSRGNLTWLVK